MGEDLYRFITRQLEMASDGHADDIDVELSQTDGNAIITGEWEGRRFEMTVEML